MKCTYNNAYLYNGDCRLRAYNSGGCVTEDKAEPNKVIEDKIYDNTFNVCVIAASQKDAKRFAKELVMEHICSKEN